MSWFVVIGKTKLNYTEKEIGKMTYRKFMKLYNHYKNNFDLEMILREKNITYKKFSQLQVEDEEWLH